MQARACSRRAGLRSSRSTALRSTSSEASGLRDPCLRVQCLPDRAGRVPPRRQLDRLRRHGLGGAPVAVSPVDAGDHRQILDPAGVDAASEAVAAAHGLVPVGERAGVLALGRPDRHPCQQHRDHRRRVGDRLAGHDRAKLAGGLLDPALVEERAHQRGDAAGERPLGTEGGGERDPRVGLGVLQAPAATADGGAKGHRACEVDRRAAAARGRDRAIQQALCLFEAVGPAQPQDHPGERE